MFSPELLEGKSPSELHQRRQEILDSIKAYPKSWDDPDVPRELLQELAYIVSTLRRKTAGPPKQTKATKRTSTAPVMTPADLLASLRASQ